MACASSAVPNSAAAATTEVVADSIWITAQAATRLRNMSNLLKGCSARLQPRVIIVPHRIVGKFNGRLVSQSACLMDGLDYFCSHFSHRRRSVTGGRS